MQILVLYLTKPLALVFLTLCHAHCLQTGTEHLTLNSNTLITTNVCQHCVINVCVPHSLG